MSNTPEAVKRSNHVRTLCQKWLQFHRPDVIKKIREEAYKKFPEAGRYKVDGLPESLQTLK